MNTRIDDNLLSLVSGGLEQCILKISRVSAGTWKVAEVAVTAETLESAMRRTSLGASPAAVYFTLKSGATMTVIMMFDPADIECVSKCYTGHSFPKGARITPAEEILLQELGNTVLNALANPVLNALGTFAMPSVPQFAEGGPDRLLESLGAVTDVKAGQRLVRAKLDMRLGDMSASSEVFAAIPADMASALERAPVKRAPSSGAGA